MGEETKELTNDELKVKIEDTMESIRTQAMLLGARSMCVNLVRMIDEDLNKPGKRTMADMKRIIKRVRNFCQIAVDHPVAQPNFGNSELSEEDTVQN